MGDAAVDQQQRMRETFIGFAHHISSTARDLNATWPMVRIPYFELHAGQVRLQSGAEIVGFSCFIETENADQYLDYVTANHEDSVKEGHMIRYGNLDRLTPIGYIPNFTTFGPDGFVPDVDRPSRMSLWHNSPPTFHSTNSNMYDPIPHATRPSHLFQISYA